MSKRFMGTMVVLLIIQFLVMVGFGIVIPILPFFMVKPGGGALAVGIFMSVRVLRSDSLHRLLVWEEF